MIRACLLLVLLAQPARADDALSARVTAAVKPLLDGGELSGLAVGVVDSKGATRVFGFGGHSGKTLFEIGSVSKVFTSLLLADFVERKLMSLDDPIAKYLPPTVKVPSHDGRQITLAHLAAHTSGLPRMPNNLTPKDPKNPYIDYTPEQLYAFLSSCKLTRDPGAVNEYSNLGAGLLGHILMLVGKQSYDALLAARITGPLGMKDTRVALSGDERKRLAPGHDASGAPAPPWDFLVLAGAGGIRSTVDDMLVLVRAYLGQIASPLSAAMALTLEPRHDTEGVPGAIGLGWHLRDLGHTVWHNGQTGGYHSYVAFDRHKQLGVVLLANSAVGAIDGIGYRLLRALAGEPLPAAPESGPKEVTLTAAQLDALVGVYELAPTFAIEIRRSGDHLVAQATGQSEVRIYATSPTHFFLRVVAAEIDFVRDAKGNVTELILHQNGRDQHGPRKP